MSCRCSAGTYLPSYRWHAVAEAKLCVEFRPGLPNAPTRGSTFENAVEKEIGTEIEIRKEGPTKDRHDKTHVLYKQGFHYAASYLYYVAANADFVFGGHTYREGEFVDGMAEDRYQAMACELMLVGNARYSMSPGMH